MWKSVVLFLLSSMLLVKGFRFLAPSIPVIASTTSSRRLTTMAAEVKSINAKDFGAIMNSESRSLYQIIDVREPGELATACLPGSDIINLPLGSAGEWSSKVETGKLLDLSKPTLCICHHGMRSMRVAQFLLKAGCEEIYNVEGGIHQYSVQVNPAIPLY